MASRYLDDFPTNSSFSDRLIKMLPKTDVHCHFDGSMRPSTLIDLAKAQDVTLPAYDVAGLRELVFKDSYADLVEYLRPFEFLTAVLRDADSVERVAREVAEDAFSEGVRYFEVRIGCHLHAIPGKFSVEDILVAMNKGMNDAADKLNATDADVISGLAPEYRYGIIVCGLRFFTPDSSPYYRNFCETFAYEKKSKMYGQATLQLVKEAVYARDTHDIPVVGLDIAGAESGFPAADHQAAFQFALENFMNRTVHGGEAYGPESIYQALVYSYAERIGHGIQMFNDDYSFHSETKVNDTRKFVRDLGEYVGKTRICVEVNLSSNFQTVPHIRDNISSHPLGRMLAEGINVCLNTDNRTVSNTTMCDEVRLAVDIFSLSREQLKDIVMSGFSSSFMYCRYPEKAIYLKKVEQYYDHVIRRCDEENL